MILYYITLIFRIVIRPFYLIMIIFLQLKLYIQNKNFILYPIYIFIKQNINFRQIRKQIQNNKELTYGEITYYALKKCFEKMKINRHTLFIDVGAGYGKTLLFFNHRYKTLCIGLEINKHYVRTFDTFFKLNNKTLFELNEMDCRNFDFSSISKEKELVIYIPGTCFSNKTIKILEENINKTNHRVTLISLSEPLNVNLYPIKTYFKSYFDWGVGTIYIQEKKSFNLA